MQRGCHGVVVLLLAWALTTGCAEDRVLQPAGSSDAGGGNSGDPDARVTGPGDGDGGGASSDCDMTGRWVVVQVTLSEALGAEQKTTNWFWMDIEQSGETFTVIDSLNCGLRVTGTTTVTLSDATTEALAQRTSSSVGRQGTMRDVGSECEFSMNRTYNLRGATKTTFLTDHWTIGDPDKPLDEFPQLPPDTASGMEDWDGDGKDAVTFSTGLGPRYAAQRDWNEHAGNVPKNADQFGGDGIVVATWDSQEAISDQTSVLLRSSATPINPGFAHYARVGSALEIIEGDELETCKNVQRAALELWPNP